MGKKITGASLEQRAAEFFDAHPHEGFRSRQVAKRLSIKDEKEFQSLRDVLHMMVDKKTLSYGRKNGYSRNSQARTVRGILSMSKQGYGFVSTPGSEFGEIFIGPNSLGTALDGDTVDVSPFAVRRGSAQDGKKIEGEIIRVLSRSHTEFVGTLAQSKNFFFVEVDDRKIPRDIYVAQEHLHGAVPGDKVVVAFESWDDDLRNPEGRIIEIIGRSGDSSAEVASVIKAFRLPTSFPRDVESYAANVPAAIPQEEIVRRRDLRSLASFTIDPYDAKDFDDAISVEVLTDKTVRIGVHIADVSAYVKEGTVLDREAFARGTSVYLANQVVPMLPEKLSNDLCSLKPNVDRLTFSCIMDVSEKGKVARYEIVRSIINSKRRFTYEEVEEILKSGKGPHAEALTTAWELAQRLKAKRMKNGSIDFDSPEAKFKYDEHGKPVEVMIKSRLMSHQLVEECMLLANQTVATHIGKPQKETDIQPFIYRIHDSPDVEKLRELAVFVKKFGHTLNVGGSVSSKELQKLLNDVKGTPEENVINEVALRAMAKAVYSEKNIGHYGLAFDYYTHFTSPIRRYPDLAVHRMLDEYAKGMPHARREHYIAELPHICKWSSDRERVAMEAERASVKVMQAEYMKQHVGDEFEGVISGVTNYGMYIEINDLLVEGMIHVRNIGDDYYEHDEKHYSLVGRRTGRRYRLGDAIVVKVVKVNVEKREIDFACVEEGAAPVKRKRRGR
ncbi:MAG TPA: ribonuclease R [Bacteroidota bacterium]|nr:ribonuclease R [Bacteroidota bacterium]